MTNEVASVSGGARDGAGIGGNGSSHDLFYNDERNNHETQVRERKQNKVSKPEAMSIDDKGMELYVKVEIGDFILPFWRESIFSYLLSGSYLGYIEVSDSICLRHSRQMDAHFS